MLFSRLLLPFAIVVSRQQIWRLVSGSLKHRKLIKHPALHILSPPMKPCSLLDAPAGSLVSVRFYRRQNKSYVWLPDEGEEVSADSDWEQEEEIDGTIQEKQIPASPQRTPFDHRDYDIEHYLRVLVTSYAARLRKAFAAEDFEQLFRVDGQSGLFDQPVEDIHPRWIGR